MVAENRESLEIDYEDLASENGEQNICYFLPEAPVQVYVEILEEECMFGFHTTFSNYYSEWNCLFGHSFA